MAIFKINGNKLDPIKEVKIDLEKNIQTITENNLENVFGLEFITSEFAFQKLRIDTLAFNPETNSFVIIEYKRDRNFSVIDQGYAYLSLMLNNKAEFILEYQEKKNKNMARDQIDWQQTRVIFIANSFTPHQQQAIQFKDLPIELWKVRKYDNNTILYNQIEAAESSVSISTVSRSETVREVSKEVKQYAIDDLINSDWQLTHSVYDLLSEKLLALDSRISISITKRYIGFYIGWKAIAYAFIRKEGLHIQIMRTSPDDVKDPEHRIVYLENSMKNSNQHISSMNVKNEDDVSYFIFIMKQRIEKLYK